MNREASRQTENALRQANRAAKSGDAVAAERWSKTAERLATAATTLSEAREAEAQAARFAQEEAENAIVGLFIQVAHVANAMVHDPMSAPGAFQGLIKLWREHNLGEGAADAEAAAARIAASQTAFLEGRFEDTLPDFVRERITADWHERRAQLAQQPVIPLHWQEQVGGS